MKYNILFLFSILFCNCGCNSPTEIDNLKDYFWQFSEYEKAKVLVYKTENSDKIGKTYYQIEKVSKDRLEVTKFNEDFKPVAVLIDYFTENGVYLDAASFFIEGIETKVTINDGLIFPFENSETPLNIKTSYRPISNPKILLTDEDSWQIDEFLTRQINDVKLKTLVVKGKSKRQHYDEKTKEVQEYEINVQTEYSKGIGITKMIQKSLWFAYTETYIKTISAKQFLELKNKSGK